MGACVCGAATGCRCVSVHRSRLEAAYQSPSKQEGDDQGQHASLTLLIEQGHEGMKASQEQLASMKI